MDDMQLVRELGQETPLRTLDELSVARRRLAMAMATERIEGDAPPRRTAVPRPRVARRRWILALATAAAAAVVSGVLVLAPDTVGGKVPAANAEAAQLLHQAAAAALKLPDTPPRPDQFVYEKQSSGFESWYSADGTRDGLNHSPGQDPNILYGCVDGVRKLAKGDRVIGTEACEPDPAYLKDLPTNADAMFAYLMQKYGNANSIGKEILFMLESHYLRPQARAALFEAIGRLPGLAVVRNVRDPGGRPGIGIAWTPDGAQGVLIFDPKTFAFLGVNAGKGPGDAVVRVAIVDKVGQRP